MFLLRVLGLTHDGIGHRSIDAKFKELRDILLPLARVFADFENHVKTLSEAVGMVKSRITSVEQTVNALSAKMAIFAAMEENVSAFTEKVSSFTARTCKIEATETSVSSGSGSASLEFGQTDGSTVTGSCGSFGPKLCDDSRSTKCRLDTKLKSSDELVTSRSIVGANRFA